MFKLTKEHMRALDAAARREADRSLAVYARRRFPDRLGKASDAEVRGLVDKTRAAAKVHGIEHENDMATLLDLGVMYGDGFDRTGWVSEILEKRDLPAPERVALLRLRLLAVQTKSPEAPTEGPAPQALPQPTAAPPPIVAGAAPVPANLHPASPYPPAPPPTGGKLPTIEEVIQIRDAEVEKVSKFPPAQRNRVAAICAAINTATGQVAVGFKIHGQGYGKSAEDLAVEAIGGNAPTVKLTAPVSPRTRTALLVSKRTRKTYAAEQFTDGTAFEE
jgi:hypothetical protein